VPRHPPSALDNLTTQQTTENKMLASTVQFSTNNQPTTTTPTPNPGTTPEGASKRYMDQVMPGSAETTTRAGRQPPHPTPSPALRPARLFFQDPTGCCLCRPPQPHQHHRSTPHQSAAVLGCAGRCRFRLASVSAYEHPTTTYGRCGLLSAVERKVAP
jgi:hypothetical protein